MNEWELTDEELYQAWRAAPEHEEDRSIAEAAQKKLVEWLHKGSMDAHTTILQVGTEDWEALCKELGVE